MEQYQKMIRHVLKNGNLKPNRTGVDTLSCFSYYSEYDISESLPLVTTKYTPFRSILIELLWYLRGEDHIKWLRDEMGVNIWNEWAEEDGYLGPAYSVLWRRFPKIKSYSDFKKDKWESDDSWAESVVEEYDQIKNIIDLIRMRPLSRRMVLNTWYPGLEGEMGLPPCHLLAVFNCQPLETWTRAKHSVYDGVLTANTVMAIDDPDEMDHTLDSLKYPKHELNCHLTQRSADIGLGVPFNIACYSALTQILAHITGLKAGKFSHLLVDAHIYVNHIEGLEKLLERAPYNPPVLRILKSTTDIDSLEYNDFKLVNYNHHPKIPLEVAV